MKQIKRFTALLITAALALTIAPAAVLAEENEPAALAAGLTAPHRLDENNNLVLEAEDLAYNTEVLGVYTDSAASGGKALNVRSEDKDVPANTDPAHIDLSFIPNKTETYSVWCRSRTGGGNSVFLAEGKDGEYKYTPLGGDTAYGWKKISSIQASVNQTAYVRIRRRQSPGVLIDKFIITADSEFTPKGKDDTPDNPAETLLPSGVYSTPEIQPEPNQHPRLWFNESTLPALQEKVQKPQNQYALAATNRFKDLRVSTKNYYVKEDLYAIEARAFDYALNGNETKGREAYDLYMNLSKKADYEHYGNESHFAERTYGHLIMTGAKVYDWCYHLLSEAEREALLRTIEAKCSRLSIGYPPTLGGNITGNSSESFILADLLSFGIAVYDERPDIYNYVAGRFFDKLVPPRNYYYQSHSYHQENGYGNYRFGWDLYSALLFQRSLGEEVYHFEDMNQVARELLLYEFRPDNQPFRTGDIGSMSQYTAAGYCWGAFLAAACFGDPYLKQKAKEFNPNWETVETNVEGYMTPVFFLLINDPDLEGKPSDELPNSFYAGSPNGQIIARTGWNQGYAVPDGTSDVLAFMKIGELWGGNHAHLDMGHFMLYYKGILASDSGSYGTYGTPHLFKYAQSGTAHNIVTVYDPNEQVPSNRANDGGYRWPNTGGEAADYDKWVTSGMYDTAEVIAHEIQPDTNTPAYSYIAGDLTKAYSDKVSESLRSMVFLPLNDEEHPGALVVMDKVTASDKSFEKNWLLHMQEEPKVVGNKTIVTNTKSYANEGGTWPLTTGEEKNNGRMVNETLLPKNPSIEKIGGEGKEFWIKGENYPMVSDGDLGSFNEPGWGRVEIGPSEPNETDYFLNVMTVSDADTTAPDIESQLIETEQVAGAVFANKAVVFNKNKERIAEEISFELPEGNYQLFLSGLEAKNWLVNGKEITVTEEGGCLYTEVSGGIVRIEEPYTTEELLEKLNQGLIEDISSYQDDLHISKETIAEYNRLNAEQKKELSSVQLAGKNFSSPEEIEPVLKEKIIMVRINLAEDTDSLIQTIGQYANELGLAAADVTKFNGFSASVKESAAKKLMFGSYSDFADFAADFAKVVAEEKTSGNNPTKRPSGGSGGSSVFVPSKPTTAPTPPPTTNPTTPPAPVSGFRDLKNFEWAADAIETLRQKEIVSGITEELFEPARDVTREEFAKLAAALLKTEDAADQLSFTDVENDAWYVPYLKQAVGAKLIQGKPDGSFGIGEGITREDMAVIVSRLLGENEEASKEEQLFSDDSDISDYAKEAVYRLRELGVIKGTGENRFEAGRFVTRAEAAQVIYNLLPSLEK